jgi:hypothetical protein
MRAQVSVFREEKRLGRLDLAAAFEVVSDRIRRAAVDSSRQMAAAGIRHALVGGLAVGAHGWPRATRDVGFLVGGEAWVRRPSGIVTPNPELPLEAHGVAIDAIPIREDEPHLQAAVDSPLSTPEGVPVAPVEVVVYMKLKSPRARDEADVVELARSGVDLGRIRAYLVANAPGLVERFDAMVARARGEDDAEG